MRIAVVGAGPIGGNIGGRLARQDKDITFIDVDPAHVQAIRKNGLQVDVPDGNFNIPVRILFPDEIEGKFDLAFIAVRTNYTGNAVNSIVPYLAENGLLVSLQNGINLPLLEQAVEPDRAIGAALRLRSVRLAPGHIRTSWRGHLHIGHTHGRTTPQLETVHSLLSPVIPTEITNNILGVLWSKLTYTCFGLFGSLADDSLKNICENEANKRLCVEFFAEVVGVGRAAGARFIPFQEYDPVTFHPDEPHAARLAALKKMWDGWKNDDRRGPIRQLKQRVKTEVDQTFGHVILEGERLNVATPSAGPSQVSSMILKTAKGRCNFRTMMSLPRGSRNAASYLPWRVEFVAKIFEAPQSSLISRYGKTTPILERRKRCQEYFSI